MKPTAEKGNSPELWNKLLDFLDERLQLGLLEHLRKVAAYHFEDGILFIQPASAEEFNYLSKDSVLHHLELLAQEAVRVDKVKIRPVGSPT